MRQTSQLTSIRELAGLLEPWDRRRLFRKHMDPAWSEVREKLGERANICVVCGRSGVWRCHLYPQEEGFRPLGNLIPLCERKHISPIISAALIRWWSLEPERRDNNAWENWRKISFRQLLDNDEANIGCHKLYDEGLIAQSEIVTSQSTGPVPEIREHALNIAIRKLDSNFSAGTSRHARLKRLKSSISNLTEGSNEWCEAHCEFISTSRRLSGKSAMESAIRSAMKVRPYASQDSVHPRIRSRIHYEEALIWMQRHPDPDLQMAIQCLKQSIDAADTELRSSAMSRLELIRAELSNTPSVTPVQREEWERNQEKALSIIMKDRDKRWGVNQRLQRARIRVKSHYDPAGVLAEIESIRQARSRLNLANGWTRYQGVTLLGLRGMAQALLHNYHEALYDITSAINTMKGGCRGKRSEGYKDLALCAVWVLSHVPGEASRANKVFAFAQSMIDGRSGTWAVP